MSDEVINYEQAFPVNEYQTKLTNELIDSLNDEVKEWLLDFITTVPYIQSHISIDKKRAKDLPRDEKGRIIVDITKPHILENMDYFRPTALCYEKYGVPTLLRPSPSLNSKYGKWYVEEVRRCHEGYIRESDGEWIPGDYYFFLNYCPMNVIEDDEDEGIATRIHRWPSVWEGHYYKFHYIWQARHNNKNSAELASRSKGKTATAAAMLAKRILLGETRKHYSDVTSVAIASLEKFLVGSDVLLDKFQDILDFCAENTEFPRHRLKDTENGLKWEIGYKQKNGPKGGIQNVVLGMTMANDIKKGRGSRASLYVVEEFGSFRNLKSMYKSLQPSVKYGGRAFGIIHLQGCVCAGTKVLREDGSMCNIEDVAKGDRLLGYNGKESSVEDITWLQPEAYKQCYRITTEDERFIECSFDHPLVTTNGNNCFFNKAYELLEGDELLIPRQYFKDYGKFSYYKSLPFVMRDNGKGEYFIGKTIDNCIGVKIKSIEDIGTQRIYNLTANTTHTYITNGFISSNTAGDTESDFEGAQELIRNPIGYDLYALENVFDKRAQGRNYFTYFFPGYINLDGYYDHDGNSDVIGALIFLLKERYDKKYNSDDPQNLIKTMAETPIVPEEAMLRTTNNIFPTIELNQRIAELENDSKLLNSSAVGELYMGNDGKVRFRPNNDKPIRIFPHNDNKLPGALEIWEMPFSDDNGKMDNDRYILGIDPIDQDNADSVSLFSIFVMDLYTEKLVAEFTGRRDYSDECYEITRLLAIFYNADVYYENNIKGLYGYFDKMNCVYMLADTPKYLEDKGIQRASGIGNTSKGIRRTTPMINHAHILLNKWLMQMVTKISPSGEEFQTRALYDIRSVALLKELALYNEHNNFDRVCALEILMIGLHDKEVIYGGNFNVKKDRSEDKDYIYNDEIFN